MSKMNELSMILDELVTCGETLIRTANSLKECFSDTAEADTPAETKPAAKGSRKNSASAIPAEAPPEVSGSEAPGTTEPAEPKTYTKEQVRGILAAKSGAGHSDEVRALLAKFGAKQLKQVDPNDYPALVKEAEAIGQTDSPENPKETEVPADE